MKSILFATLLLVLSFSAQADYSRLIDAVTLGASLSRADIKCDEFIANFKEFDRASTELLNFFTEAGELEAKDAQREMKAMVNIDIQDVFNDLGRSMNANLTKCEKRLHELDSIVQ